MSLVRWQVGARVQPRADRLQRFRILRNRFEKIVRIERLDVLGIEARNRNEAGRTGQNRIRAGRRQNGSAQTEGFGARGLAVYFWIIPAACGLFAIAAIAVSAVAVLKEKAAFDTRSRRLSALGSFFDTARAERAVERVRADVDAMPALIARSQTALLAIQSGVKVLSMRRARTAIALAALSIRALSATLRVNA